MRRWMIILVLALIVAAVAIYCARRIPADAPSSGLTPAEDKVQLSNVPAGHLAAVILVGRRASSCPSDEVVRTSNTADVGNILSPSAACKSRIAVFVQDRAMYFDNASAWTDNAGDNLPVTLADMPQLPISIWVPTGGTWDANANVLAARPIYNNMQSGIGFEDDVPIVENPALDTMSAACSNLGPVKEVGNARDRLNVYYVQEITEPVGARGVHCGDIDPNVILISKSKGVNATFAHEVGHTLTLDETNDIDGLNKYTEIEPGNFACNLMLQMGVNQKLLSTGQSFRGNLNGTSAINTLAKRPGPKPGCHKTDPSAECPAVSFDVVPK